MSPTCNESIIVDKIPCTSRINTADSVQDIEYENTVAKNTGLGERQGHHYLETAFAI